MALNSDTTDDIALQNANPKLKRPSRYIVLLLNDDYTPMDFVVEVLELFFGMNHDRANQIMLQVHQQGKGICGIFTRDIAETKVLQVINYAQEHEHPLLCRMEKL
ncbi:MAG: ATP-dependent Clp protease adapter ClpS [Thiomargarita sp.]|nr:ATP-dependent Clp protease adapter ClpS [Thiomargarita sp.]